MQQAPLKAIGLAVGLGALLAGEAQAQGSFEQTFIKSAMHCWARTYDARHLAAHPRQLTRTVLLQFRPMRSPVDGKRHPSKADNFEIAFGVMLKGDGELYSKPAYCRSAGDAFVCNLESDGGQIRITREANGGLRVATDRIGFEGSKRFIELGGAKSDDRTFVLTAAAKERCRAFPS